MFLRLSHNTDQWQQLRFLRQNDIDLLFGPSSQDLLSEILFVVIAQIICCIWHCWDYVAFGTGTVGIMLHLAMLLLCGIWRCVLALLAICYIWNCWHYVAFGPVVVMWHLGLLSFCCVGTVGNMLHLELLALCSIWHWVTFKELALHLALIHIYRWYDLALCCI